MSRPRTNRTLLAIGVISSACALVASYLYLVSPSTELSSVRRRRKILVSSASATELLNFISNQAEEQDDLYCSLLLSQAGGSTQDDESSETEIEDRCHYLVRHEKAEGLTHIARHMSPDLHIVLPSLNSSVNVAEIRDWVGKIVVMTSENPKETMPDKNVKYVDATENYWDVTKIT